MKIEVLQEKIKLLKENQTNRYVIKVELLPTIKTRQKIKIKITSLAFFNVFASAAIFYKSASYLFNI